MRQQPTAPGWRRLPPRYRTHEEEIVSVLALAAVDDLPLLRGLKAAFAWLREMAGRGGRQAARLADQVREGLGA